ncbi:MAG: aminotransferase class I/II-fold pyridoxal phosphate-dependent enzyme [Aggregatilineales bacterium]
MTPPERLARPLASRLAGLPAPMRDETVEPIEPPGFTDAAIDALNKGETHYADRPGLGQLRNAIARDLNTRSGLNLTNAHVTITCGAAEARFLVVRLLAKPGSLIVCPSEPAAAAGAAHLAEAQIVQETSEWTEVSLIYLTPACETAQRDALLERALASQAFIIWDLAFAEEKPKFNPAQIAELSARTLTIDELSPSLAGWRVGWIAGQPMVGPLRAFKQSMTIATTTVSQWAALSLFEDRQG